jgi:hypothetical protein
MLSAEIVAGLLGWRNYAREQKWVVGKRCAHGFALLSRAAGWQLSGLERRSRSFLHRKQPRRRGANRDPLAFTMACKRRMRPMPSSAVAALLLPMIANIASSITAFRLLDEAPY